MQKWGKRIFSKQQFRNDSLHQDSNDNGVSKGNFATSKNLFKSTMIPHRNIQKYTWTCPDRTTHNLIDHILIDRRWHLNILDVLSCRGGLTVILITIWWLQKLGKDWQ